MRPLKKIGLIAGSGSLPVKLVARWEADGFTPVIVAFANVTEEPCFSGRIHDFFSLGEAGKIMRFFREKGVADLVMIGAMQRPDFWRLRVDWQGFLIVLHFIFSTIGDDRLLRVIRRALEKNGFTVRGVHEFLPDLLCPEGVLGKVALAENDELSLRAGLAAAKQWSLRDEGQAVIISEGKIIAFEDAYGTNALIDRSCAAPHRILLKICKAGQDMNLDLPTVGLKTVELAAQKGFSGIALEAGASLLIDRAAVAEACDHHGMFLVGVKEGVS